MLTLPMARAVMRRSDPRGAVWHLPGAAWQRTHASFCSDWVLERARPNPQTLAPLDKTAKVDRLPPRLSRLIRP